MKKLLYVFGILSMIALFSFSKMGFHSTMTKVDYIEGTKTLKFTTKINAKDISKAINTNPNTAGFEAKVKQYVGQNFNVYINGMQKRLTFTGSQVRGATVFVYFEVNKVNEINTLKIKNGILLKDFPTQLNSVNIAYKSQQKTMNFRRGAEVKEVKF
ncbi:MAG: M penetrans family 1 protein [Flavobacteriales bacterium]|nr:MAG: M penetrans family 1 protein [Flavobacteriales bacterium]